MRRAISSLSDEEACLGEVDLDLNSQLLEVNLAFLEDAPSHRALRRLEHQAMDLSRTASDWVVFPVTHLRRFWRLELNLREWNLEP
jgi:hypothetical protein